MLFQERMINYKESRGGGCCLFCFDFSFERNRKEFEKSSLDNLIGEQL